jgi:hypothetical protein
MLPPAAPLENRPIDRPPNMNLQANRVQLDQNIDQL